MILVLFTQKKADSLSTVRFFVSALPIFPGRRQPSIFGAGELNCRVRDGNGWTLTAISTDSSMQAPYRSLPPSVKAHSLRCISSPSRTHFVGLRSGFKGTLLHVLFLFQPLLRLKPLSSPQSVPTPGGVVHLQGLEPGTDRL